MLRSRMPGGVPCLGRNGADALLVVFGGLGTSASYFTPLWRARHSALSLVASPILRWCRSFSRPSLPPGRPWLRSLRSHFQIGQHGGAIRASSFDGWIRCPQGPV